MNAFRSILGQPGPVAVLGAAVESGRLAHAYLLAGPVGCGRLSMALDLAACSICPMEERGFCGECPHCRRILRFQHPDVRITLPRTAAVTPEQEAALLASRASDGITPLRFPGNTHISIHQIREIESRLSRKSFEGQGQVEIIVDAHLMRREAANALLKTLEEPPGHTLLVLTTSFLSGVLPTVRSRAHGVRLGTLPTDTIRNLLLQRTHLSPEDAEVLASSCGGSPGRALSAAAQWAGRGENRAKDVLERLSGAEDPCELLQYAGALARELGREGLLELCEDVLAASHRVWREKGSEPPHGDPALSEPFFLRVQEQFRLCGVRVRGNVSPAMALEAAMLGSRGEVLP